jgi:hypothetical protein
MVSQDVDSGASLRRHESETAKAVIDDRPWPSGWWILPCVALGVVGWVAIFWAILRWIS